MAVRLPLNIQVNKPELPCVEGSRYGAGLWTAVIQFPAAKFLYSRVICTNAWG